MAVIDYPGFCINSMRWVKQNQAVVFRSVFGAQSVDASVPLWAVDISGVPMKYDEARRFNVFLDSVDGYRNQIALWNYAQPVPAGTMRGSMEFATNAAQGATSITITAAGQAGNTLLAGDLIGFGSGLTQQVVRVMADAVADSNGDITVSITPPLRNAFSAGAPVTWDKPRVLFRQRELSDGIEYTPGIAVGWVLSLIEDWRP